MWFGFEPSLARLVRQGLWPEPQLFLCKPCLRPSRGAKQCGASRRSSAGGSTSAAGGSSKLVSNAAEAAARRLLRKFSEEEDNALITEGETPDWLTAAAAAAEYFHPDYTVNPAAPARGAHASADRKLYSRCIDYLYRADQHLQELRVEATKLRATGPWNSADRNCLQ